MGSSKYLLGPMRLPFLVITPACVILGLGAAVWSFGKVSLLHFMLALIGALAAHISVNAFNEYFDFKSGLDARTERTPFSGGSGTLPGKPEVAGHALATAFIAFAVAGLIGLYFLWMRGLRLLPLGLLGLLTVIAYTPWLARHPLLCLIAPGLGFGCLIVMGTAFVLTGEYTCTAFVASLVPFFLVSDLLLLNQFPDVEADRSVGRRHYPIVIGRQKSSVIYAAFLLLANLTILLGVSLGHLPGSSLIGLITLGIAGPVIAGVYRNADDVKSLMPYMTLNVVINVVMPVLVAIGLLVG